MCALVHVQQTTHFFIKPGTERDSPDASLKSQDGCPHACAILSESVQFSASLKQFSFSDFYGFLVSSVKQPLFAIFP